MADSAASEPTEAKISIAERIAALDSQQRDSKAPSDPPQPLSRSTAQPKSVSGGGIAARIAAMQKAQERNDQQPPPTSSVGAGKKGSKVSALAENLGGLDVSALGGALLPPNGGTTKKKKPVSPMAVRKKSSYSTQPDVGHFYSGGGDSGVGGKLDHVDRVTIGGGRRRKRTVARVSGVNGLVFSTESDERKETPNDSRMGGAFRPVG